MNSGFKGTIFSCAVHGAALAALLFFTAKTQGNDVVSASDPLLAMFAGENADPTKAAGLVDEAPGLAEGSSDGNTLKAPDFSEELDALNDVAEAALERPLPEPNPVPAEPEISVPVPAKPTPIPPEKPAPAKPKPEPKKPAPKKPDAKPKKDNGSAGKKMSLEEFRRQNKKSVPSPKPGGGKKSGSGKRTTAKIDVSKVISGGGGSGGKRFGVPGGTGGNGGDGGRAVASAQQVYASEVAQKLAMHLDNVLEQQPLTLDFAVSVEVRIEADSAGNIRLLEVIGNHDSQVRDRISKAISRIGKFRKPPEGRAFSISLPNVVIRPQ